MILFEIFENKKTAIFKKHDKKGTYCFPWAEETIGDDLSACGGNGETEGLIFLDLFWCSHGVSVDILEHLVETEFTESLERVTNPGWEETDSETLCSIGLHDLAESIADTLVHTWHSLC